MNGKVIREEYLSGKRVKPVWGRIEKYETATGAELLQMERSDLIEMIDSWEQTSPGSVRNDVSDIRQYFDWAIANNFLTSNVAREISYRDIDYVRACRNKLYPDVETILEPIRHVLDPDGGFAIYPIIVFAWMGIQQKEAPLLERQAVNLETGVITCQSQTTFPVLSAYLLDYMRRYDIGREHVRNNGIPMLPGKRDRFLYKMDFKNQHKASSKLGNVVPSGIIGTFNFEFAKKYQLRPVDYHDIAKAGILFEVYQKESDGIDWSVLDNQKILRQLLNAPEAYPGDAMIVYEAYKKAFDLH